MRGGEAGYQEMVILGCLWGVADDARGSGVDDKTVRADVVAGADLGDGLTGKGLPLADHRHIVFGFHQEPSEAIDAPNLAMPILQGVGMKLPGFHTDDGIPVLPLEPSGGVLTEGTDLDSHEPVVMIPVE